jgi:putative membrane protein
MTALPPEDRQRIETAVAAAETRTSSELAVVVAHASDHYAAFPLLWSAMLAFVAGGGMTFAVPAMSGRTIFAIEAVLFVAAGLVFYTKALRFRLVPAAIGHEHASRLARLEFAGLVHERTQGEVGLLLFVSLAERHVEILPDRGIASRVEQAAWQEIIETFVAKIRTGDVTEGILTAIESCTTVLERHFPPARGKRNEISNRVTEI